VKSYYHNPTMFLKNKENPNKENQNDGNQVKRLKLAKIDMYECTMDTGNFAELTLNELVKCESSPNAITCVIIENITLYNANINDPKNFYKEIKMFFMYDILMHNRTYLNIVRAFCAPIPMTMICQLIFDKMHFDILVTLECYVIGNLIEDIIKKLQAKMMNISADQVIFLFKNAENILGHGNTLPRSFKNVITLLKIIIHNTRLRHNEYLSKVCTLNT